MTLDPRKLNPRRPVRVLLSTGGTYEGAVVADDSPDVLYLDQTRTTHPNLSPEASRIVCIVAAHIVSFRYTDRPDPKTRKGEKQKVRKTEPTKPTVQHNLWQNDGAPNSPDFNAVWIRDAEQDALAEAFTQEFGRLLEPENRIISVTVWRKGKPGIDIGRKHGGSIPLLRSALDVIAQSPEGHPVQRIIINYRLSKDEHKD